MALEAFSETNCANSVATFLANKLLTANYLVYWHAIDTVQTPDGWYPSYSTESASYATDVDFAARLSAAAGLITLSSNPTANPAFAVRPKNDGTVPPGDELQTPHLAIEVAPWVSGLSVGLGDTTRTRTRHLCIYGLARDRAEQSQLRDALATWFDEDTTLTIADHDQGSLAEVGTVRTTQVMADSATIPFAADAMTFELVLNARLEYEA